MDLGYYQGSTTNILSKGYRVVAFCLRELKNPYGIEPFLKVYMVAHCVKVLPFKMKRTKEFYLFYTNELLFIC